MNFATPTDNAWRRQQCFVLARSRSKHCSGAVVGSFGRFRSGSSAGRHRSCEGPARYMVAAKPLRVLFLFCVARTSCGPQGSMLLVCGASSDEGIFGKSHRKKYVSEFSERPCFSKPVVFVCLLFCLARDDPRYCVAAHPKCERARPPEPVEHRALEQGCGNPLWHTTSDLKRSSKCASRVKDRFFLVHTCTHTEHLLVGAQAT